MIDKTLPTILLCFLITSISCQSQHDFNNRIEIFKQVWNIVNDDFYAPEFNGVDWEAKHSEYKAMITDCSHPDSLFSILNEMLFELNSSHCGVGLISELENSVSPYLFSSGEVGIDVRIIENEIVITDVVKNSSADSANIKVGFIIRSIDGFNLTDIQRSVNYKPPFNERNRKFHLTSEVLRRIYGKPNTKVKLDCENEDDIHVTKLLTRVERKNGVSLGGGMPPAFLQSISYLITKEICYLSFNAFNPSDIEHVFHDYEKVKNTKGLIIDLRGNDGGSIEAMKLLLGKFISERVKYGTYINRYERNDDFIEPLGEMYNGKVVLLVDEMSISGAENMAGIFQQLNIGKVIGNQTPGQMLWGSGYLINDSIALAVPIYKLEYQNGFNPENNGIKPDIVVGLKREDLLMGRDTQLERAIEYLDCQISMCDSTYSLKSFIFR